MLLFELYILMPNFFCSFDQELAELCKLNSIKVQILFGTRNDQKLINNQVICNEACDHKIKVLVVCLCQKADESI